MKDPKMKVNAIAAAGRGGVVGKDGKMPWGMLPVDMQKFKEKTMGCAVVMGRKTYESIGKPLPARTNIVLTSTQSNPMEGAIKKRSLVEALSYVRYQTEHRTVWVIGGQSVWTAAIPHLDEFHLTMIMEHFEGDTYIPDLSSRFRNVVLYPTITDGGYQTAESVYYMK